MSFKVVCSNKPHASTQKGAKGSQWWKRDVYHVARSGITTLCGIDCSDWLRIGNMQALDGDCCKKCFAKAPAPITEAARTVGDRHD